MNKPLTGLVSLKESPTVTNNWVRLGAVKSYILIK